MPAVNIDVLQRLIFFLQQLMFNSHINKMHASNLGLVWGPNLLFKAEQETVDPNAMFALMATTTKIKVISTDLIENYRTVFEPTLKQIAFRSKTVRTHARTLVIVHLRCVQYALFDAKLVGHAKSIIGGAAVRLGDQTHLWSVDSKAIVHVHRVEVCPLWLRACVHANANANAELFRIASSLQSSVQGTHKSSKSKALAMPFGPVATAAPSCGMLASANASKRFQDSRIAAVRRPRTSCGSEARTKAQFVATIQAYDSHARHVACCADESRAAS